MFEDLTKEGWTPHRLPGKGWLLLLAQLVADTAAAIAAAGPAGIGLTIALRRKGK
ncbi:hypothetical protein PUR25_00225 [Streptomyces sp. JV181]|uniref:hypothetical protein n=1 Tax=Streptomyces sp. JV181 TaxID=858635 RepID=UPI002E780387|nr:hypothetical protein [Streptomyces sp. JV181]MEE1774547.1 hypothetical protein [Streptomyces sp. JV181]